MAATLSVNVPKVHTSEARYALCSLRPLCEANIHHSVRKKQSKSCLNSADKKIFVNIPVANHITRRVLSHADCTDFHGFFFLPHTDHTNRTEAASQGVLAAWRLRRVYTTGRLSVRIMYLCSYVKKSLSTKEQGHFHQRQKRMFLCTYVKKEPVDKRTGLFALTTETLFLCQ